jgi:hypothetical protein
MTDFNKHPVGRLFLDVLDIVCGMAWTAAKRLGFLLLCVPMLVFICLFCQDSDDFHDPL